MPCINEIHEAPMQLKSTLQSILGLGLLIQGSQPAVTHAQSSSFAGIYTGSAENPRDEGYVAVFIRTNHITTVIAHDQSFDTYKCGGIYIPELTISSNGTWNQKMSNGSSSAGEVRAAGFHGTYQHPPSSIPGISCGVRSIDATNQSNFGAFQSSAGYYAGDYSRTDAGYGGGTAAAMLCADGSLYLYFGVPSGGFNDDGGTAQVASSGSFDCTSYIWGAEVNGTLNRSALLLTGTYTIPALGGGTFTLSRKAWIPHVIAPAITTDPQSQSVVAGATVTFSVVASGTPPLTYRWQKDGKDVAGATGATLTLANVKPTDAGAYTVAVSNEAGTARSNPAQVTVVSPLPEGSAKFSSITKLSDQSVTLVMEVKPERAYVLESSADLRTWAREVIFDAAASSSEYTDSGQERWRFYRFYEENGSSTPLVIVGQPQSRDAVVGEQVVFAVDATGVGPLSYQWLKNGEPLAGETKRSLVLNSVELTFAGAYTVVVSDSAGSVESASALLTVEGGGGGDFTAGSLDTSFQPGGSIGYSSGIGPLAVQRDGGVLVGVPGPPTLLNGELVTLLRLDPDGTLDTSLPSATSRLFSQVFDIAVQADNRILVAGDPWPNTNGVVRLTSLGAIDGTFVSPNRCGRGVSICPNGEILVYDCEEPPSLFRCSGSGEVLRDYSAALQARLDRAGWSFFILRAMSDSSGQILVLGQSELRDDQAAWVDRNCFAVLLNPEGSVNTAFAPEFLPDSLLATAVFDRGEIAISGFVRLPNHPDTYGIARFRPDGSFQPGTSVKIMFGECGMRSMWLDPATYIAEQLPLPGGGFLVVGRFDQVDGVRRRNAAVLTPSGSVAADFAPDLDGPVYSASLNSQGNFVLLGDFHNVNGIARDLLCTLSRHGQLTDNLNWRVKLESDHDYPSVSAVVESEDRLFVFGSFNQYDDRWHPGAVSINLAGRASDRTFAQIMGLVETACVQPDGNILVGGDFTCVDGVERTSLARMTPAGTLDPSFHPLLAFDFPTGEGNLGNPEHPPRIETVTCDGSGHIYVLGEFTHVNGTAKTNFARLNLDGSLDLAFTFDCDWTANWLEFLGVAPGGAPLVMAYDQSFVDGFWQLAEREILKLLPSGKPDPAYTIRITSSHARLGDEYGIHVGSGYILMSERQEWPHSLMLRLIGPDAKPVSDFSAAVEGGIHCAFMQADRKIVIAGSFSSVNGAPAGPLARLDVRGSLDLSFQLGHDFGNGSISRILSLRDGRLLVVGDFSSVDGHPLRRLALFHNLDSTTVGIHTPGRRPPVFPECALAFHGEEEGAPAVVGAASKFTEEALRAFRKQEIRQSSGAGGVCVRELFGVRLHHDVGPAHGRVAFDQNLHARAVHFAEMGRHIADDDIGVIRARKLQDVEFRVRLVFQHPLALGFDAGQPP